jgi:FkbM family methyltransferase
MVTSGSVPVSDLAISSFPLKYRLLPPRLYKYLRYISRWRKAERREEPELRFLKFLVPRSKLAVDIGANKGTYTLPLSWYAAGVHAFEPHPMLFRYLTDAFPGGKVTVHSLALSNKCGESTLKVPVKGQQERVNVGSLLDATTGRVHTYPVRVETLDAVGLTRVGFIKIDVEGAELDVLAGATATITRDRPNILCEILDFKYGRIKDGLATVRYLEQLGYFALAYDGESLIPFPQQPETHDWSTRNFIFLPKL